MSTTDYSSPNYPIVLPSRLITSLADFTAWVHSDDFPQQGRVTYLQGRVEIDMRPERLEGHTKLKNQLAMVLQNLTAKNDLGHFYGEGARFSNADAG